MNSSATNTPSNAIPASAVESRAIAPAVMAPLRHFYWSVRRELWENRSIYMAPLAAGAVTVVAFLIALPSHLPQMRAAFAGASMQDHREIQMPYDLVGGLMMLTTMIVAVFYCLDALYGERRDRSILFWKSLPVSDTTAVLAKASVPLVILPVIGWAVTSVTQLLMAVTTSIALIGSNVSVWDHVSLLRMSVLLLYHLITVHALWWAPFFGWMLMISAWAPRAPILWAVLPLVAIAVVEKIAFNTFHVLGMLQHRLMTDARDVISAGPHTFPTHPMTQMTPLRFITNPDLWIGFGIMALFLAAAVRLRRYRGPA